MAEYKIIFSGPVGAGKTTAITTISDTPPVKTDAAASDMTRQRKKETTVAMDYGILKLDQGEYIHLYGTPGQERFDFMWDILATGGIGLILLIDNTHEFPFKNLQFFLNAFNDFIKKTGLVIGVTKMDTQPTPTISDYQQELKKYDFNVPVFEVDAREKKDISLLIQALLFSLEPVAL